MTKDAEISTFAELSSKPHARQDWSAEVVEYWSNGPIRWFHPDLRVAGPDPTEFLMLVLSRLSRPSVHDGGSLAGKLSARVSSIISSESSLVSE